MRIQRPCGHSESSSQLQGVDSFTSRQLGRSCQRGVYELKHATCYTSFASPECDTLEEGHCNTGDNRGPVEDQ